MFLEILLLLDRT